MPNKDIRSSDAESNEEIVPISLAAKKKKSKDKPKNSKEEKKEKPDDEIINDVDVITEAEIEITTNPRNEKVLEENLEIQFKRYSICLILGVAYAATLGGIATLIGTGKKRQNFICSKEPICVLH